MDNWRAMVQFHLAGRSFFFNWLCTQTGEINPLNAELNPIRHLLALVGARHIVHVSRIRVKKPSGTTLLCC